jgi:NAD(P)-dependent dehydrogenase (short-subunit alcohol dehydrogenase family)
MKGLDQKVVIITGAARGIGAATARLFTEEGATVVLCDILEAEGQATTRELERDGRKAAFYPLDVTSEDGWARVTADALSAFGRIDVLVNNAGGGSGGSVDEGELSAWEQTIAICQTSAWLGMRAVIPHMRQQGGGAIVNVGSVYAVGGGFGEAVAYHSGKAGLLGLTRNAAIRLAKQGIRVNIVHPGFSDTPMAANTKLTPREGEILAATPMGRRARPDEIGRAIRFMASDEASFVTGAELFVDGGWTAK